MDQNIKVNLYKSRNISKERRQLEDLLTCQICLCKVSSPCLCPHCSKLYCLSCMQKNLEIKSQCPNCRRSIRSNSLSNCQRFIQEISDLLNVLVEANEQKQMCVEHHIILNYYCTFCNQTVCCECKIFGIHKQHNFLKIETIFQEKFQKIKRLLMSYKQEMVKRQQKVLKIEHIVDKIECKAEQISQQTQSFGQQCKQSLQKLKIQTNQCHPSQFSEYLQRIDQIKQQIHLELEQSFKTQVYFKKPQLSEMVDSIISTKPFESKQFQNPISKLHPPFKKFLMNIQNYSHQKEKKRSLRSQIIEYEGYKFKMRVQFNQKGFISVFLELVTIPSAFKSFNNEFCYQIWLKNYKSDAKKWSRNYQTKLKQFQSCGFVKFIGYQQIQNKGFLSDRNEIQLTYLLRLSQYSDLYKRRVIRIKELQNQVDHQKQFIEGKGNSRHSSIEFDQS